MFIIETQKATKRVKSFEKAVEEAQKIAQREKSLVTVYDEEAHLPVATFGDLENA